MLSILELSGKHIGKRVRVSDPIRNLEIKGAVQDISYETVSERGYPDMFYKSSVRGVIVEINDSNLSLDINAGFELLDN